MRAQDAVAFSDISATTAAFPLEGGKYALDIVATTWNSGSVGLQRLGGDGATYVAVGAAITANGIADYDVPPGRYRIAVTSATAVYAQLVRVPGE